MGAIILRMLDVFGEAMLNALTLRNLGCLFREHNTLPLRRVGKYTFITQCVRCGGLFIKTHEPRTHARYLRYHGAFTDFEDYAAEMDEAEPMFRDVGGANA